MNFSSTRSRRLIVSAALVTVWLEHASAQLHRFGTSDGCPLCTGSVDGEYTPPSLVNSTARPPTPSTIPVSLPSTKSAPALPPLVRDAKGYLQVSFEHLASFPYFVGGMDMNGVKTGPSEIPARVKKLEGENVSLRGYMLPVKMDGELVTEFLLLRSPMACCFGVMPTPTEVVFVTMKGKGVPVTMDTPLQFYGKLHVREVYDEKYFIGIYAMDGVKVSVE